DLYPALRYLRAARAANVLVPRPHARLGVYAQYFASSEPAAVHFARAKRLLPTDPDIWFASGREALSRGDATNAWADWKHSLTLSTRHLRPILIAAKSKLTPEQIRSLVLPDDPVELLAAADVLYPDRASQGAERRPFLEAAVRPDRPGQTADQYIAQAVAL